MNMEENQIAFIGLVNSFQYNIHLQNRAVILESNKMLNLLFEFVGVGRAFNQIRN